MNALLSRKLTPTLWAFGATTRNFTRPSELNCGYSFPPWFEGAGFQSLAGSLVCAETTKWIEKEMTAEAITRSFRFMEWDCAAKAPICKPQANRLTSGVGL